MMSWFAKMTNRAPATETGTPKPRRGLRINYALNVAGTLVPLAISLVVVPIYIVHIGAARYGILSLVWILLGYFGFLDFGLSRASANALSRLGNAGPEERVPVLVTSFYLNIVLGAFGSLVIYFAGRIMISHMATMSGPLAVETVQAMPWIACMLPLALISGVGTGAIESRERFGVSNLFTAFGGALGQILPISCALLFGPSLAVVVPAALLARVTSTVLILAYVVRTEHPVDPRRFDRRQVRQLLGYGAWVSVTSLISPLLETFDQMLVGTLLGPAAIAHYTVPMNMATRSQIVATALAKTLFPRLSRLEREHADQLTTRAIVTLAYAYAALCAPAIILAGPFLGLWIGGNFAAAAAPVAAILLVGAWANGVAFIPYTLLQSQGRPDLTAKIHACEVLPFLGSVWLLTTWFGLPGAAFAWTLRTSLDLLVLLRVSRLLRAPLLAALPSAIVLLGCCLCARVVQPTGLYAVAMACVAGGAVLVCALVWDGSMRTIVGHMLLRVRSATAAAFQSNVS
jgi:O-antigen/teichoic acid export membrane protein